MKNLSIQNKSFLSLNKSNLQLLEKQSSSLLAIGVEKFSKLLSKTKVANEKKLVQSGKFENIQRYEVFHYECSSASIKPFIIIITVLDTTINCLYLLGPTSLFSALLVPLWQPPTRLRQYCTVQLKISRKGHPAS